MELERKMIYDSICRVLTDFEEGRADVEDLYGMLCDIQNHWETVITAS